MRVLMIAQSFYDYDARILRQTSALIDNGNNVDIICLGNGNYSKQESINNVNVYRIMRKFPQEKIFIYVLFSIIFLFKAMYKSLILMLKNKYDIVQIHNMPDYLVFASLFYKLKGTPIILDIHDLTVELFKEKWGKKNFNLIKTLLIFVEKISTKYADNIITVSDQCGLKLQERGVPKEKLTIVMNVADSSKFHYYKERKFEVINRNLRLIYHGTIAERYGLHKGIKALPAVVKQIPGTIFNIYGNVNSEYGKLLKELVADLSLKDVVVFNDTVPYEEVYKYINSSDLGIIMSQNASYAQFGIPTKTFEYASLGLPFIIYDLKSFRNVYREESVYYVDYKDISQMSNAIINLCKNPEMRNKMSVNAYADIQKVSSEVMKQRYLNLINSLNNSHSN